EVAIGRSVDAIDKIRTGKMQALLRDFRRFKSQQGISFCAEIGFNFSRDCSGRHFFFLVFPHARKADSYSRMPLESIPPAAASTSHSSLPFFGSINCAGICRSEEHTSELQSRRDLVCRLLLEKKKNTTSIYMTTKNR